MLRRAVATPTPALGYTPNYPRYSEPQRSSAPLFPQQAPQNQHPIFQQRQQEQCAAKWRQYQREYTNHQIQASKKGPYDPPPWRPMPPVGR